MTARDLRDWLLAQSESDLDLSVCSWDGEHGVVRVVGVALRVAVDIGGVYAPEVRTIADADANETPERVVLLYRRGPSPREREHA